MFVAIRHDAQEAVGPFADEDEAIEWARDKRDTSGDKFYIRPIVENWS